MNSKSSMAAILGAIFILAGGSSRAAYAAPPTDACTVLTPARVSAILGASVSADKEPPSPFPGSHPTSHPTCWWSQPGVSIMTSKRAFLDIFGPIGRFSPVDRFNNGKTPVHGVTKTPISGIGDDAYYITSGGLGTGLNVRKGSSAFQIRVYGFSLDQIKAMEKTLAQDVLAKL